jgi:S1-C subfamily serine protease
VAVNSAKSSYNSAINQYNFLVGLYNSTPAIVSQDVYLPYSFRQGDVVFGWQLEVDVRVAESERRILARSIERDFVRLGSKLTDSVEENRRPDPIDFGYTSDDDIGHLTEVAEQVSLLVDELVASIEIDAFVGMSEADAHALRRLLHPSGTSAWSQENGDRFDWLGATLASVDLSPGSVAPPAVQLESPAEQPPAGATPEELTDWYLPIVGEVRARGGSMGGSSGSAVVISSDGVMLTCAHVLTGADIEVELRRGPWSGVYVAEPTFVNERFDVALLRVEGLSTTRWAPVRLDEPARRGEEILALGNPSLGGGDTSFLNVTRGIVANPRAERAGAEVLIADVSVSSGSSGGPLVALTDGAVVGVIQAVASAGLSRELDRDIASSGFTCFAAPAQDLKERLGLVLD